MIQSCKYVGQSQEFIDCIELLMNELFANFASLVEGPSMIDGVYL